MRKKILYGLAAIAFAISLAYDRQILLAIESIRTPALNTFFTIITKAGTFIPIPLLIASAIMFHKKTNKKISAAWLAVLASLAAAYLLKYAVGRGRPDFIQPLQTETSPSFPSGHAAVSFAPTAILRNALQKAWIIFAILVAFSRAYLGVHYMSDIIAGALLGSIIGDTLNKHDFLKKSKTLKKLKIA